MRSQSGYLFHRDPVTNSETYQPEKSALLLIRTPLQAWIAKRVLKAESVRSYDLVYFTHNDSYEDLHYFKELANEANRTQYCYAPVKRYDIFNHLDFYSQTASWRQQRKFHIVCLASIDSPVINALAAFHATSECVTFDDGLANIMLSGAYYRDAVSLRLRLYKRFFGATDLSSIKSRIIRHYTIYPGFQNIVEKSHLRYLDGFCHEQNQPSSLSVFKTYFIGQPFEEALCPDQIVSLKVYLRGLDIDYYVRHPREQSILNIGVPVLDKHGLIAEDAILRHAQGHPIHLVGWFSTALFNMAAIAQRRTMLLIKSDPNSEHMATLARQAGCEIVFI
jgi:N-acetyllactosaminide alpha-2,3-sialyltransferase